MSGRPAYTRTRTRTRARTRTQTHHVPRIIKRNKRNVARALSSGLCPPRHAPIRRREIMHRRARIVGSKRRLERREDTLAPDKVDHWGVE